MKLNSILLNFGCVLGAPLLVYPEGGGPSSLVSLDLSGIRILSPTTYGVQISHHNGYYNVYTDPKTNPFLTGNLQGANTLG
jgi:hypothetical protein